MKVEAPKGPCCRCLDAGSRGDDWNVESLQQPLFPGALALESSRREGPGRHVVPWRGGHALPSGRKGVCSLLCRLLI